MRGVSHTSSRKAVQSLPEGRETAKNARNISPRATKTKYLYEDADELHNFVRKMNYREKLNNTALHIYFSAMPELEKKKGGFCQPTTATYKEIAKFACISVPSIKPALDQLNGTLCETDIGKSLKAEKQATRFRRYTIKELQNEELYQKLKNERPQHALELQRILADRRFIYGDTEIKPYWSIGKTGRLNSSKPNILGNPEDKRSQNICHGLQPGEVLFDIDYKQAEPTVIQHAANFYFDCDPYQKLGDILGIPRDEAKEKLNMLHYVSTDPVKILKKYWTPEAAAVFMPYAEALQKLRQDIWTTGKPQGKGKRRFVKTLGGSIIEAERGNPPHRGQILGWYAQGTIADILNPVCLEIIKQEQSKGWRFIFPVHDSAYVIGKPEHEVELKKIFKRMARNIGLDLSVEITKHQSMLLKNLNKENE